MLKQCVHKLGLSYKSSAKTSIQSLSQHFRALCYVSTDTNVAIEKTVPIKSRTKLKIPSKRAAFLLLQLNNEQVEKSVVNKNIADFKPGDSVEVQFLLNRTVDKTRKTRGVVIARRNRGVASSFVIRNVCPSHFSL
uniref:50S ribosomal protein L19, chloroplastic n=1 Tax=Albugo laibachii Nc14 TaxID=890382 RepID=F0WP17_9STRA|nr:conserved hypothetical protein [Albugo laibachii Nc14]|eukprot:CCA23061.1 conserved hypothetical protein [Albugo laibachii Nc14]